MKKVKPRKEASQERAKVTVDSIVQAAGILLKESGLKGLTTNKIVEKAGVSIGSLYQYFPGKEAILAVLLERQFKKDLKKFKVKLEEITPDKYSLKEGIQEAVDFFMVDYSKQSKVYKELLYSVVTVKSLSFTLKHDHLVEEYLTNFFNQYKGQVKDEIDMAFFSFFFQYTVKGLKFGISFASKEDYIENASKMLADMVYQQIKA
jgi:AcrR family transcriptional regulator